MSGFVQELLMRFNSSYFRVIVSLCMLIESIFQPATKLLISFTKFLPHTREILKFFKISYF